MRFVVDMNLSPQWVGFLRGAGHEAVHWVDVGHPAAPDREIVTHAVLHSGIILTQDLDFGILLALGGLSTPSVVQFRAQAVLPGDIGAQLVGALDVCEHYLQAGALVTVRPDSHRVTVLPIGEAR